MKSKHILYTGLIILTGIISSCKKNDLLNQIPPTALTQESFWNTPNDLRLYVNNLYSVFPLYGGFSNLGIYSIDGNSDNMITQSPNARLNGALTVNNGAAGADWVNIRNANLFLANYKKAVGNATEINKYLGEAYFFRAFLYFNALRSLGDLQWINKPLNIDDEQFIYSPRLPRNVVVDSIVNDLDRAITNLPLKRNAESQRIHKEFAMGLKARICLFEGTWEKYHAGTAFGVANSNGEKYLNLAQTTAKAIMDLNSLQLDNMASGAVDGYFNLFNQVSYAGSGEIMFWGAYNQTAGIITNWQNYYQEGSSGGGATGLSKSLVDDYLCTDGKPISVSPNYKGDLTLVNIVQNRDPRLRQSIFINNDVVVRNVGGTNNPRIFTYPALVAGTPNTSGFQIKKGLNTDFYQDSRNGLGGTDGVIYMRYAEILLIYAEAKAELGTFNQNDADISINLLRRRVGMPNLNVSDIAIDSKWLFPALSPIINEVRRERRVELACEGHRFFDIVRWAAAPQTIVGKHPIGAKVTEFVGAIPNLRVGTNIFVDQNDYIKPYGNIAGIKDAGYSFRVNRDYLLAVPVAEINKNPTVLKQNPGWN